MALTVAPRADGGFVLPRARFRALIGDYRLKRILAELPASSLKYEDALGAPGTCSVTVPIDHPDVTRDTVWPAKRTLYIERDGEIVWGGWVWTVRAGGDVVEINAEGWWSYFRRRWRTGPWKWADTDQLAIARHLLAILGEDPSAMPEVDPNPATSGVLRTWEWIGHDKNAASALEELARLDLGFDWSFTFAYDSTGWPVPTLHFHYPYRGIRRPAPLDASLPIVDVALSLDGTKIAQAVTAFGKDNAAEEEQPWLGRHWTSSQPESGWEYPQLQDVLTVRDLEDIGAIQAAADAERKSRPDPIAIPTVSFESPPDTSDAGRVEPGDVVHVRLQRGWIDVNGLYRVTARQVDVSDISERLSFTLAPRALAGVCA